MGQLGGRQPQAGEGVLHLEQSSQRGTNYSAGYLPSLFRGAGREGELGPTRSMIKIVVCIHLSRGNKAYYRSDLWKIASNSFTP